MPRGTTPGAESTGERYPTSDTYSTAEHRDRLNRVQSAAARRILSEANSLGSGGNTDSLETWASRAQQVVSFLKFDLNICVKKVSVASIRT